MIRLAIVVSHPTQYYSPWFRCLAADPELAVRVFYLWDFGVTRQIDPKFGHAVQWDIPLLAGYEHEFVPNLSADPGTQRIGGLYNPALPARISQFRPDAILVFGYGWRTMLELLTFRRPRGIPLLLRGDSHLLGRPPRTWISCAKDWLISRLVARCAGVLAVGRANADFYRGHRVPEERIFRVPHCVDNDRFSSNACEGVSLRHELGIPDSAPVALFAGKFESKKCPELIVQAFLDANVPDAWLVLAGSGALDDEIRRRAAGCPRILILPFQNQTAMPRLYSAADVLVLFSRGPGETWGLAVNEAMNCGCGLILSTHVGCAADLLEPGGNGLLVEAGDVPGLAAAFRAALTDSQQLESWKRRSREIVASYSYEQARRGLWAALREVVPQARVPASTYSEPAGVPG